MCALIKRVIVAAAARAGPVTTSKLVAAATNLACLLAVFILEETR